MKNLAKKLKEINRKIAQSSGEDNRELLIDKKIILGFIEHRLDLEKSKLYFEERREALKKQEAK